MRVGNAESITNSHYDTQVVTQCYQMHGMQDADRPLGERREKHDDVTLCSLEGRAEWQ